MKSKNESISMHDIFASAECPFSDKEVGEFVFHLWFKGDCIATSITEDEARGIVACLQHALDMTKKGGSK